MCFKWQKDTFGKEKSFVLNFVNRFLGLRVLLESVICKFACSVNIRHKTRLFL